MNKVTFFLVIMLAFLCIGAILHLEYLRVDGEESKTSRPYNY